jgi:nucleolar protein 56
MSEDFQDFARFSSVVTIVNFKPFSSAKIALDNINAISDKKISKELRSFLIMNLPKVSVNKTS